MSDLIIRAYSGGNVSLNTDTINKLRESVRGKVLTSESEYYHETRSIWNAMIDRYPAMIVQCTGASDVVQAVRFGVEHKLLVSIHGAGHNIAGNSVCDGGLMIDLSKMKSVRIDPKGKTARVEPGVTLGEFDR